MELLQVLQAAADKGNKEQEKVEPDIDQNVKNRVSSKVPSKGTEVCNEFFHRIPTY